ncbi:MAG TPA: prephenate dehydratase [Candidatus Dormibacteraeota bacterium]|nr:prephenate dehydratase [Candidatus Dormibacteraeota bacterium]
MTAAAAVGAVRVAYLGPEGTHSHDAALRRYPAATTLVPFPDIATAVTAAFAGLCDEALVPIENSTEGSIAVTLDLLVEGEAPPIVGELVLPVRHQLIARPGVALTDVERVVTIPQASAQCRHFLRDRLPGAQVFPAVSTAAAVAACVHSDRIAAIGTQSAATLYGMEVLAADIQDHATNATRFVALGGSPPPPTGRDRTSIVFSLDADRPGDLVSALAPFSTRRLNLSKIESRPTKVELGSYHFLIDCEGHAADERVAAALADLAAIASALRVLGSYPRAAGVR